MKQHHILTAVLLAVLLALAVTACAAAAEIRPIPIDHDATDLGNGEYRMTARSTDRAASDGYFIAVLYSQDHYGQDQIRSMAPGDTVYVNDRAWTVREIVIHRAEGQPEEAQYEIYAEEELDGYIVFVPCNDGTFVSVMNDWNPVTLVGSVRVNLPLPDDFEYIRGEETTDGESFTEDLANFGPDGMNPYNTTCAFRDGQLVRVESADYPYGPADDDPDRPIPVWKFCRGLRDGLDTAVITAGVTDCEEGPSPAEITPEEEEWIRQLAVNGMVTGKANDLSVTGGTRVYTFTTPGGKHLLSIELYDGLIVGNDGMYTFEDK